MSRGVITRFVHYVNGDIAVTGRSERISAHTVNGTIEVTAESERVEAQSVGGRIVLKNIHGDVTATTVGGEIDVEGGRFERGKFSSVSGSIQFTGGLDAKAVLQTESHSGDVVLTLPAEVSAEFEVTSFSGRIHNDFGSSGSGRQHGPGRQLSFSTGQGDARVTINTFSGDVQLVKK